MFLQVLDGVLPEALHHEEVLMMQRTSAACIALDREVHQGALMKVVPLKPFFEMLHTKVRPAAPRLA